MSTLECAGLVKSFGGVNAVSGVSFTAGEGEIVGVIGPNGSGKSTLLNLITGVLVPDAGTVRWRDEDITALKTHRRARRGLVRTFQEEAVFKEESVLANLSYGLLQAGQRPSRKDCRLLAESVGLPERLLDEPAKVLSWGQGRLIGLAMVLSLAPSLALLDEPFAGLNRTYAQRITELLLRTRASGTGLVIVEHEMSLLLPLCDRVVVLVDGVVICSGTADEVLNDDAVRAAYFGTRRPHADGS